MFRKSLAIPAALILALSGTVGNGRFAGQAHARTSADSYSGTIVFTDNVFPDSLPDGGAFSNNTTDFEVAAPLFDALLGIDNHQQFFPDMATEVPSTTNSGIKVVSGHEVVTYHLKPNLKWSDGSPITHNDFVIGLLFNFSPEYNSTNGWDQIQTITFSGNDIVETFKGIYAPALFYTQPFALPFEYFNKKYGTNVPTSLVDSYDAGKLSTIFGGSYKGSQLQKMVVAWTNDAYHSTSDLFNGPYKLAEWSDQQRITEVPNTFYNILPADKNHPRPAKIQFVIITLSGTAYPLDMASNATYNNVDLAEDFRLPDLPTVQKSKYQIVINPALSFHHLELNQANPALADVRVRQALQYAIDKTRYIQSLFAGVSPSLAQNLASSSFLPSTSPWVNTSLPANGYDPAKAKSLLAAAGYATSLNGSGKHLSLTFTTFGNRVNIRSSQLIQRFWAQIGVTLRMQYPPASGPNGELSSYQDGGVLYHRRFDVIEFGFSTNVDPDQSLADFDPKEVPNATHPFGQNYAGINDPTLYNLFQQARHTLDNAQRHTYYNQAQERFYQNAYWIMLYNQPNFALYKGTIGNFKPNPTQAQNEWNAFEWYRTSNAKPLS